MKRNYQDYSYALPRMARIALQACDQHEFASNEREQFEAVRKLIEPPRQGAICADVTILWIQSSAMH